MSEGGRGRRRDILDRGEGGRWGLELVDPRLGHHGGLAAESEGLSSTPQAPLTRGEEPPVRCDSGRLALSLPAVLGHQTLWKQNTKQACCAKTIKWSKSKPPISLACGM